MFKPGIERPKRENGEEWGLVGFEEGAEIRLPHFFFNHNNAGNWGGYQAGCHDERFNKDLYSAPGGCPESSAVIATLNMVAKGEQEGAFTAGDQKNLEYLIDKGFCIRENGRPVVHAIVLDSTSSAYFDEVAATGEYKELQLKMKELVDNVRSVITRFSNPYIKDFLDYYTMMFTHKFKDVIACLLKDKGLYSGSSAQFCALYLD